MADESAELIGGISVSVGASHDKLVKDLENANRLLDQWKRQVVDVQVGAQFVAPIPASRQPAQAPTIKFGAAATTSAQAGNAQTALQRRINEELAKTGEMYDSNTGEIVSQTRAIRAQRQAVTELQQTASNVDVNFDTSELQGELDKVLATLREIAAEAAKLAETPVKAGGGGRTRRPRAAGGASEGDDADPYKIKILPNISSVTTSRGRAEAESQRVRYSTGDIASLQLQEAQQEARAARQREAAMRTGAPTQAQQQRAAGERLHEMDLIEQLVDSLTPINPNRPQAQAGGTGTNAARPGRQPLTAEQQAASERQRAQEREYLRTHPAEPLRFREEGRRGSGSGTGGGAGRAVRTEEDIAERERQRVAVQEAQRVSAGRTARTQASGLGGFGLGGGRGLIEAQAALAAANEKVVIAQRRLRDPAIERDLVARRHATEELTVAQNEQAEALKKVQSFSGFAAGARNLVAVTAAGAAFGLGLEAINIALKAGEKAAAPYFDQFTGYAQKTADLTGALADQARAQQGQAQAVTAVRLAQSGFSQSAAASIQPIIAQRVQIEAGNKALVEQIETFRIAENLRKQGANTGIGGAGTGGVLGTSLFGIPSTGEQVGNFIKSLTDQAGAIRDQARPNQLQDFSAGGFGLAPRSETDTAATTVNGALQRGLAYINQQLQAGGGGRYEFQQGGTDKQVADTAAAFAPISKEMAEAVTAAHLYSDAIASSKDPIGAATEALRALNLAASQVGKETLLAAERLRQQQAANSVEALKSQFAYERPATLNRLQREQDFQIGTQIPAQAALQNIANPPTPVGTGIAAEDQGRVNATLQQTAQIQDRLNTYYQKGYEILQNTYQIPPVLLNGIKAIGAEMATTQAGIANQQAEYQVAQFNYQLQIARRTLRDINGLTGGNAGGAGQSFLGRLERENLALSRQSQLLQFNLSQRQINFQQAVAGFQVPGLTPAEQNARVEEAKITTSYAQKQLDIQRQMFGNQVQIVDISNLRQASDLASQIGLLLRGRELTIDTAAAQQKLARLQAQQQILVQEAGTYISKVNAQVSTAMSEMEAIEKATGRTIANVEVRGIAAAYKVGRAFFLGISGGFLGQDGGGGGGTSGSGPGGGKKLAGGGAFNTMAPTRIGDGGVMGEAGSETLLVLSHPRAATGGGGAGGGNIYINFGHVEVKTEADFQRLYRMVVDALGRDAATKGLRTPF